MGYVLLYLQGTYLGCDPTLGLVLCWSAMAILVLSVYGLMECLDPESALGLSVHITVLFVPKHLRDLPTLDRLQLDLGDPAHTFAA